MTSLTTNAEKFASKAADLPAFGALNLSNIRRELEHALSLIGRAGFFDQYTLHNIGHIEEMLRILDWLIPERTRVILSPADWLLIVLAIYFHDFGMLVTEQEYAARLTSAFPRFRDEELFSGPEGEDYRVRVYEQYPDPAARERFLYQEFVRSTHAKRIGAWVQGTASQHLGLAAEATAAITELLGGLNDTFRRDLALVCESHHLDDLNDTRKYKTSKPYGNSREETANVQYAAVLLRTADLLHITRDRTPSITFRLINPSDPASQQEWAKHRSVRSVRAQLGKDDDGLPSESAEQDTIEVHATFNNADGFFGLTSYLWYAKQQLRQSYDWIELSRKSSSVAHEFPWRHIDDTNIEAVGFLPQPFAFELDQARILDLLTGHTLYNDTGVVLRELVQNALDAVRLQATLPLAAGESSFEPKVQVSWNSGTRALTVEDNGTGMTQQIIERHLLRVGSSRYQDPEFRKQHPSFSAISRFGIGVLSCFMIADDVEITTCHPTDEQGRHLTLRSVHGKYLIRLLNKESDPRLESLAPHGTRIQLKLRPSSKLVDVLATARYWILIPGCSLTVTLDDGEPERVGYTSPREALKDVLETIGYSVEMADPTAAPEEYVAVPTQDEVRSRRQLIRVHERQDGPVTLAYAVVWSEYFTEWSLLDVSGRVRAGVYEGDARWYLGTALEGIRVEQGSPGFRNIAIAAIANASGPSAPKTNVARSSLEATSERTAMLESIYKLYADHVAKEVQALHDRRGYSLTWATLEAAFLLAPLITRSERENAPQMPETLLAEVAKLPIIPVEQSGRRSSKSPLEVATEPRFWTSDSALLRSAESLLKEVPSEVSVSALMRAFEQPGLTLPEGLLLARTPARGPLFDKAFERKEVSRIVIVREQRRVDLLWERRSDPPRWRGFSEDVLRFGQRRLRSFYERSEYSGRSGGITSILVATTSVPVEGIDGEHGVRAAGNTYMLFGNPLTSYLSKWLEKLTPESDEDSEFFGLAVFELVNTQLSGHLRFPLDEDDVRSFVGRVHPRLIELPDMEELVEVLTTTSLRIFDPDAWRRDTFQLST